MKIRMIITWDFLIFLLAPFFSLSFLMEAKLGSNICSLAWNWKLLYVFDWTFRLTDQISFTKGSKSILPKLRTVLLKFSSKLHILGTKVPDKCNFRKINYFWFFFLLFGAILHFFRFRGRYETLF